MSKYYKAEDVISFLNTHCPKDMWEYQIADLPTIEVSEDCISRSALISFILKDKPKVGEYRPQGHYIKGENGEWYCSNCRRIDDKYSVAKFCWHCGAEMRGSEE